VSLSHFNVESLRSQWKSVAFRLQRDEIEEAETD